MGKIYTSVILAIILITSSFQAIASPQMPDYIIFRGDTVVTYNLILEQYLQRTDTTETGKLFGLSFRDGSSLNCWRGYQAIYKIDNDSLFLVEIIGCGEWGNAGINKVASYERMKNIFSNKLINNRVFINWFSGDLNFPIVNKVLRWDGVFYKTFEKEELINFSNGAVINIEEVENYIDDPKRINRKDRNKIADILFKKLKKINWNVEGFDCSDKYLVTIDENGDVSKVRMIYTEEEINKYYDAHEYNVCIDKILNALKKLKFDIIKDKGKSISEDIYIEIWIEDGGRIENWTRH